MEHYIEHAQSGPWTEKRFGDGTSRLPGTDNARSPSNSYFQLPRQYETDPSDVYSLAPSNANVFVHSPLLPPVSQQAYDSMKGITNWMPSTLLTELRIPNEMEGLQFTYADVNSSCLHNMPSLAKSNVRDRSNSSQAKAPQDTPTWCQSYINKPRSEGAIGSSGEGAHDEADLQALEVYLQGKNTAHTFSLCESRKHAHVGSSELLHPEAQQLHQQIQGGAQLLVPLFGTHTGVAQPQGAAAVVAGTARPRVRARRGQATDPHSIAERLRRERIAERMKALQELVPNANKTDKASMLDEIIDYVKFLQLQVKVLSMSRLGGAGAVAPLISDFPGEGQNNLALGSSGVQDGMVVAERQVARLMEEDMGSAMQFLQAKGLCLMPISLASTVPNNSRMETRGGSSILQGLNGMNQSRMHTTSSTGSTLASVASSGCVGGEGDSRHR